MNEPGKMSALAPTLIAAGVALVGVNWYLQPDQWAAWTAAVILFGCMTVALLLAARRRSHSNEGADAYRQIVRAIVFAGLMMIFPLCGKLAVTFGLWESEEFARRGTQVLLGLFLALTGNAMPKTLTPLAAMRCDPAKVQAFQRFAGWTFVMTGLSFALIWLMLPLGLAHVFSTAVVIAGMLLVITQIVRIRRAAQSS